MEIAMENLMRDLKWAAMSLAKFSLPLASVVWASLMVGSGAMAQTYPSNLIKVIAAVSSGSPIL
jgi:hypothetical protein